MKFNELTVLRYNGIINREKTWICQCSCGETTIATTRQLNKGRKKSCGHLVLTRKKLRYKINDDYVTIYTHKGEEFKIDLDDLDRVIKRSWYMHHTGYLYAKIKNKGISLQRFIMNPSDGEVVDHINHDTTDNRKVNLRVCLHKENSRNLSIKKK